MFKQFFVGIAITFVLGNIWEYFKKPTPKPYKPPNMKPYRAIVIGSTGAIGSALVVELLNNSRCEKVTAIARRDVPITEFVKSPTPEMQQRYASVKVDFDQLDSYKQAFQDHDVAFCTLGTTIKDAGSQEAFKKVDYGYVKKSASLLSDRTKQFSLVTSNGANPNSWNFYLRTKGEIEEAIKAQKFQRLSIFRPSLLLASRKRVRPLEMFAQVVFPYFHFMLVGPLRRFRAIEVEKVARAMVIDFEKNVGKSGEKIYESEEIEDLSNFK